MTLLLTGVISSVLGGRARKKSGRALRYLTGSGGGSFWTHPATLLTAAGLAWGVYETMNGTTGQNSQWGGGGTVPPPGTTAAGSGPGTIPPIPAAGAAAPPQDVDADALRLVRLAISAANADGVMTEQERSAIVQQARAAGVEAVVERALQERLPLAEIVAGVTDPGQRATLYVLAFTVLRADEQVTGAERIYLAQLAHLLGLDPDSVQRLEKDTGERIDALGDQGQPGG